MLNGDAPRAAAGALLMVELGARHGADATTCLRGTGLAAADLRESGREIDAAQELAVVANLVEAVGHVPGLALEAGGQFRLTTYGIWGYALLSSATIGDALDLAMRHLGLAFAFTTFSRRTTHDEEHIVLTPSGLPHELRRFLVERDVAGVHAIQQDIFPTPVPIGRLSLAFPRPPDTEMAVWLSAFGAVPEFDAPENVISIDRALLDEPLPLANASTAAMAWAQCREVLDRRVAATGLAGQVRDLLLASIATPPSALEVAHRLHLSERTLRQRLADEGTTYREVLEQLRFRLAEELLRDGQLSVGQVARRLGYVEVSSFSRAVRRWSGNSPRTLRESGRRDPG